MDWTFSGIMAPEYRQFVFNFCLHVLTRRTARAESRISRAESECKDAKGEAARLASDIKVDLLLFHLLILSRDLCPYMCGCFLPLFES